MTAHTDSLALMQHHLSAFDLTASRVIRPVMGGAALTFERDGLRLTIEIDEDGDTHWSWREGEAFLAGDFDVATEGVNIARWFRLAIDERHLTAACQRIIDSPSCMDGLGAPKADPQTVRSGLQLALGLMTDGAPMPEPSGTTLGGVQFDWDGEPEAEVEVSPGGRCSWWYSIDGAEEEGEGSLGEAAKALRSVLVPA